MYFINIAGDGNFFYRSLSLSLYRYQNEDVRLRKSVADFILKQAIDASSTTESGDTLHQRAIDVAQDGTWAGEDIIFAAANCFRRSLHAFVTGTALSPLIYTPLSTSDLLPLLVA